MKSAKIYYLSLVDENEGCSNSVGSNPAFLTKAGVAVWSLFKHVRLHATWIEDGWAMDAYQDIGPDGTLGEVVSSDGAD
jgi:hypothetical protein